MPLIDCPECGREISAAAEACPQCGHPTGAERPASTGPECYACSAPATTQCQSCGTPSCVEHLQAIFVQHGKGGANELRCESCYSSARAWKVVGGIVFVIILIVFAYFFFNSPIFNG